MTRAISRTLGPSHHTGASRRSSGRIPPPRRLLSRRDAAAVIPTYTPEEAIRELEYAVLELGHKAVMVGTEIRKPYPEVFRDAPQFGQFSTL